jgi:excinuclease ABC subunit B
MPKVQRQEIIKELKAKMLLSAKSLDFEEAARLRDEIAKIKKL